MDFELANTLWRYDNGRLYWKMKVGRGVGVKYPGDIAGGTPDELGYFYVSWKRKHYFLHRIVFLLHHKYFPECVDHIDCDPSNNKIENLRAATRTQNQYNRRTNRNTRSGVKGVSWHPQLQKWNVRLWLNGKTTHFGVFEDIELAELVAIEAREKYHGKFARHA